MTGECTKAVWVLMLVLAVSAAVPAAVDAQEPAAGRKVTKRVSPEYPPIAKRAHLTGTVKMIVTIAPEGTVRSTKTLGGNPLFVSAAEVAVKQWTFEIAKAESNQTVAVVFGPGN